ncbi:MAG: hypothetical protein LUQ65_11145 [Candidatus Helarchaeota archaeon]|nr:hypothetical protein [Candidatus Helarchaeota archaeon]
MEKCALCQKSGDISLLLAHHKDLGNIYVCNDCWRNLYAENELIGSVSGSCGPCGSSTCGSCGK